MASMNALPIIVGALCLMAISYRYYSAFIAAKVLALDDSRPVPSDTMYDGHNYYPTNKWVLFGHHFAAISGAGPLIGPVLAAQFGFLPGLLWLVIGVCLGGAVHDFMILGASIRRKGKSLAEIALTEISPISGFVAGVAILFIVVIALAGLGLVVVNALAESPWGTFTVGFTIPLALFMGLYMYRFRKGRIVEASVIGVVGLLFAVFLGGKIADSSWAQTFTLSRNTVPGCSAMYSRARVAALRSASVAKDSGAGTAPSSGAPCPGLVPHVTNGLTVVASRITSVSNVAPSSVARPRQCARAASQSAPFGA